ncbi:MAG: sulfotransferase, partial [Desulfobacterales bacterium]
MREITSESTYIDPVFIVGMPRSGTTLIQGILSNTGKYFPMPETHFFSRVAYALPENGLSDKDRKRIRRKLIRKSRIKIDEKALFNLTSQKEVFEYVLGLFNPDKKNTFLEKTPRHVFFYSKILRYYPKAKFICMVREPKNIVSSRLRRNLKQKKSVIRLSLLYNKIAAAILDIKGKDNVMLVRYEDLTDENEFSLKKICKFLTIPYDGQFLKNVVAPKEIVSAHEFWKNNNLALQTIRENNPDKWRTTLNMDQAHLVNYITR